VSLLAASTTGGGHVRASALSRRVPVSVASEAPPRYGSPTAHPTHDPPDRDPTDLGHGNSGHLRGRHLLA